MSPEVRHARRGRVELRPLAGGILHTLPEYSTRCAPIPVARTLPRNPYATAQDIGKLARLGKSIAPDPGNRAQDICEAARVG